MLDDIVSVERVAVLCRFLDMGSITKSHVLKYSLAHAFCCFLASIEDVNPAVATRARLLLDSIKRPALQVTETWSHQCVHDLMKGPGLTCLCVSSTRACVCAWTSSLTRWSGTVPSSWANCCCCTRSDRRSPLWAGSSSSTASRRCPSRPSCTSTATKSFPFLQVSVLQWTVHVYRVSVESFCRS